MKQSKRFLSLFLFLFMPVALLSGCESVGFDGLVKDTRIHNVGSKAKMTSLLKDAQEENASRYGGWAFDGDVNTPTMEGSGSVERDYVDTNEQVEGVKEGDIVKTDGYQIFYAPRYHNVIRIVDVEDDYDVSLEETIELGDTYVESLYLLDDYLVVIGYTYENLDYYQGEEYMSYCWWSPTGTVVVIDRQSHDVVYRLMLDSFFMDHRIIDDSIFLISHKYVYYGEVGAEYRPVYEVTKGGETVQQFTDFDSIFYFDDTPAYGMNVMTGIKLANEPQNIAYTSNAYLGASSYYKNMYVNASDLYLVESTYHYTDNSYYTTSTISQFALDIDNASSSYVAAIIVAGMSLNQFSLDVYDGYLRIATTERRSTWSVVDTLFGWFSETTITNHLFVLRVEEEAQSFDLVGHLSENLGKPNEDIKSVRFEGETAYIVTFRLTDPLYVIDLSNPALPVVAGEIIQKGFDTYQHLWGDGNLIGIGYDADSNGIITGMKISAYNVNVSEEEALQTYNIFSYDYSDTSSWSYGFSEALYNHKALLVSVEKGYLGFAVQAYEYGYDSTQYGREWYYRYHSYYYLFKIDFAAEDVISEPLIIEHPMSEDYYIGVDRGVMVEDCLYTISDYGIITYSLINESVVEPTLLFE
ncbi:MAG: hypothetical protein EOM77_04680 [Bacteroidia bacterium]|nr:hypothetical protein [Bacteroidia bacterium]